MKCLFTIGGLQPEFGGPSQSVPALAEAIAQNGVAIELLTCEPSAGIRALDRVPVTFLPPANRSTRWRAAGNDFFSVLRSWCATFPDTIIHDNGLWLPNNHAVAVAAGRGQRPLIISPRGMLSSWALRFKGWKKGLAWWLYQHRDLQSAAVLHATSQAEAGEFRALGLRQPIAIIPNGTELPPEKSAGRELQYEKLRTLLFLGRIHPVKGLPDLIKAWSALKPKGWRVVIAGCSQSGHQDELERELKLAGVFADFSFVGAVEGNAKWELYRKADLFVLPSHAENFGIVVAEALACGVPVIASRGAPWEVLQRHRCGWWSDRGPDGIAAALREAISLTDVARWEMGERGRQLVKLEYSWAAAAEKMLATYRWMLGQGAQPDCVNARC